MARYLVIKEKPSTQKSLRDFYYGLITKSPWVLAFGKLKTTVLGQEWFLAIPFHNYNGPNLSKRIEKREGDMDEE